MNTNKSIIKGLFLGTMVLGGLSIVTFNDNSTVCAQVNTSTILEEKKYFDYVETNKESTVSPLVEYSFKYGKNTGNNTDRIWDLTIEVKNISSYDLTNFKSYFPFDSSKDKLKWSSRNKRFESGGKYAYFVSDAQKYARRGDVDESLYGKDEMTADDTVPYIEVGNLQPGESKKITLKQYDNVGTLLIKFGTSDSVTLESIRKMYSEEVKNLYEEIQKKIKNDNTIPLQTKNQQLKDLKILKDSLGDIINNTEFNTDRLLGDKINELKEKMNQIHKSGEPITKQKETAKADIDAEAAKVKEAIDADGT
ncbi:hypothetical protein ACFJW8_00005, partial [Enterococcus faecalis]